LKAVRIFIGCAVAVCVVQAAWGQIIPPRDKGNENFEEPEFVPWVETEAPPPAAPRDADLEEFYVSASSTYRFFLDRASLAVGADGVVRYTLVVESSRGARNVSYEGLRCNSGEIKRYASGRSDGSWSPVPNSEWREIAYVGANRHHAALWREYLCRDGAPMPSVALMLSEIRRPKGQVRPNRDLWAY
jgi:hypothetical protein